MDMQRKRWLLASLLLSLAGLLVSCGNVNHAQPVGRSATATSIATATATSPVPGRALSIDSLPTSTPTSKPRSTPSSVPTHSTMGGNGGSNPPVSPVGTGSTLPPGSALPSEAQCAASIHRSSFEPRPENGTANASVPTSSQIAALGPWGANIGQSSQADQLRKQITGNFTGTTDEILQWTACKWGIDPNIVRAEAVVESYWKQSQLGDYTSDKSVCPPGTWDGKGCYQSYGILQIKYVFFQDSWPMSKNDTAFSAEYTYAILRACYEGWTTYLNDTTPLPGYPAYHAGDIWGCLGRWFSGNWYDQGALDYIQQVKSAMADKTWLQDGF